MAAEWICPMCLTWFSPEKVPGSVCPGCQARGKTVGLMSLENYLAMADFDVVEGFWRGEQAIPYEIRMRMLDRVARLRDLQARRGGVRHRATEKFSPGGILLGR